MELREFGGYLDRELSYTFPLHWVNNIKVNNGLMMEIQVDEINIK
jgi:hypothetical protein